MEPKILSGKECAASVNAETQAMAEKYIELNKENN